RVIYLGTEASRLVSAWLDRLAAVPQLAERTRRRRGGLWRIGTLNSYRQAFVRLSARAGLDPHLTPSMVRRYAGRRLRREAGLDATQVLLGHAHISTTEIYGTPDVSHAITAARDLG
ncbi:MAG: tyrosine-type recombinase/integrase, partial [Cyanobacteria bacterium J06626_18]